jgi:sodium/potassium-transporting ATPase subunit alpha
MQWGNLLATRTRRLSLFQTNPFGPNSPNRNPWIPPAILATVGFLFFFSYVPFFQNIFLTRVSLLSHIARPQGFQADFQGVPVEHIFLPFAFALGLIFLDEARKYCVRTYPKGILARIAW